MKVPFFRPAIGVRETEAVVECLQSGWLTTGERAREFELRFASFIGAKHAVAVNSCTAALHLALEAIGLKRGDLVFVPTFTFAATAEVVRYFDAVPVFVDSDPVSMCMDPQALASAIAAVQSGTAAAGKVAVRGTPRAVIPVHYAGQMADMAPIRSIAARHGLVVIGDAAHALPADYRENESSPWQSVGASADISCFSFYANKCITTGEGGMLVTDRDDWAERVRVMSLHGMSKDAYKRFMSGGSWYYEIVAPGFKYNLTDIAASIGLCQLDRVHELMDARREIAAYFSTNLSLVEELEVPLELQGRRHAWHLYAIRLRLSSLTIDRNQFIDKMIERGVAASVHWMPLHMHPYYRDSFGYAAGDFPVAAKVWSETISLPIFPGMTLEERAFVVRVVTDIAREHRRTVAA